jgi:hypothetical protein
MRRLLIATALAGLLISACGDDGGTSTAGSTGSSVDSADTTGSTAPAGSTTPPDTASPEQAASAPEILQFSAPVVGGGELDLRSYAGQTVAFWFWAPT